jgi:lambda repressor-like predicted transcriptional regulator
MVAQEIRKKVKEKGISYSMVAEKSGLSPAGLCTRLKTDNMKESDIVRIAEALDCVVEIRLIDK